MFRTQRRIYAVNFKLVYVILKGYEGKMYIPALRIIALVCHDFEH